MSNTYQMMSTMEKNKQGRAGKNVWRGESVELLNELSGKLTL